MSPAANPSVARTLVANIVAVVTSSEHAPFTLGARTHACTHARHAEGLMLLYQELSLMTRVLDNRDVSSTFWPTDIKITVDVHGDDAMRCVDLNAMCVATRRGLKCVNTRTHMART